MIDLSGHTWAELLAMIGQDRHLAGGASAEGQLRNAAWTEVRARLLRYAVLEMRHHSMVAEADLDDVVNEVLVRLLEPKFLASARDADAPAGFLRLVIRRRVIDWGRKSERERRALAQAEIELGPRYEIPEADVTGETTEVGSARLGPQVSALLGHLPQAHAEILRLHYLEGMTVAEIAERLGISTVNVRVRIFRALRELRTRFGR